MSLSRTIVFYIVLQSVACLGQGLSGQESVVALPASPQSTATPPSVDDRLPGRAVQGLAGTSPSQTITLEQATAMAMRSNPRVRGAAAAADRASAGIATARAYTNPSLEVFQGRQYARPIATPGVAGLLQHYGANQTIEVPLERRSRIRTSELASISSKYGQQRETLSVIADTKHAFYNVLRRREEIEHQQENLRLVEDLRRRVEVEVNVGEKGRLELTRAEAELARARYAVRSAQLELANSIALLRVAIAAPADASLDPIGTLEPRVTLPPLAEMREVVLRTHPAVSQSLTEVQVSEANLNHEQAQRIPRPVAFAEFENQPDLRYWRAGVTVPIPLWDRRRGQIAEAKAAISQANAMLDQQRLELISATERSYEQYLLADQQATALESGELRAAESAVDAAKAAYTFGERGIVELLDAQRVLQSVRGDLLDAQFARQSSLVDLEELGAFAPQGRP